MPSQKRNLSLIIAVINVVLGLVAHRQSCGRYTPNFHFKTQRSRLRLCAVCETVLRLTALPVSSGRGQRRDGIRWPSMGILIWQRVVRYGERARRYNPDWNLGILESCHYRCTELRADISGR